MWNTTEEGAERRRVLLRLAAKGNAQARKELEQEYHAFVYTPAEAAQYVPKEHVACLPGSVRRKLDALLHVNHEYDGS
jgi:hypothetical protein